MSVVLTIPQLHNVSLVMPYKYNIEDVILALAEMNKVIFVIFVTMIFYEPAFKGTPHPDACRRGNCSIVGGWSELSGERTIRSTLQSEF